MSLVPSRVWFLAALLCGLLLLTGCQVELGNPLLPTIVPPAAPTLVVDINGNPVDPGLPPTWTPDPNEVAAGPGAVYPTFTPRPTRTPPFFPSRTPRPTATSDATAVSPPTATPFPTFTPLPTASSTPPSIPPGAANVLPNASFEGGWYHIGNLPELQVASDWMLEWEEGQNPLDPDPWNGWVRPEARVLTVDFLPPAERNLFIWDGEQTVKVFKGRGAINFRLFTFVDLQPGTYVFTIHFFPDMVDEYLPGGGKVWAPDPLSGEVRFLVGNTTTDWVLPEFGHKNTMTHTFVVTEPQTMRMGAQFRGRWAIENNGWFMDDWSLVRAGD